LAAAQRAGLIAACHDCSDGGLAAGVAEMAIGGCLGARIELALVPIEMQDENAAPNRDLAIAFCETPGRFLCEVPVGQIDRFAAAFNGVAWAWIGEVTTGESLEIVTTGGASGSLAVDRLARAWRQDRKEL